MTFQPAINRRSDGYDHMDGAYHQDVSVFDRLLQYATRLTEKKQMQEHMDHRPLDPVTGRQLFTPLTGRKPQIDVSFKLTIQNLHISTCLNAVNPFPTPTLNKLLALK